MTLSATVNATEIDATLRNALGMSPKRTRKAKATEPVIEIVEAAKPKRVRAPKKVSTPAIIVDPVDSDFVAAEEVMVDAHNAYRTVWSYNNDGSLFELGRIRHRDYEPGITGGRTRAITFENTQKGTSHSLGSVSQNFQSHTHAQVLRPFMQAGFEPRTIHYNDSGIDMIAFMAAPAITFADTMGWDMDWLLENGTGLDDFGAKTMELAVRVKSSLRPGYSMQAELGFYRLVCKNGMVAQVLGLGSVRQTHRGFDPLAITSFLDGAVPTINPATLATAPTELLDDVIDALDRVLDENGMLPRLLKRPASIVARESGGAKGAGIRENLLALRSGQETMTKLDLINVTTNVAHVARSPFGVYRTADVVTESLVDLVDLAGVKHGVPTFENN